MGGVASDVGSQRRKHAGAPGTIGGLFQERGGTNFVVIERLEVVFQLMVDNAIVAIWGGSRRENRDFFPASVG